MMPEKFSIALANNWSFVDQFSNVHGFESISYDLSSNDNLWNNPITIDKLNLAIRKTKNTTPWCSCRCHLGTCLQGPCRWEQTNKDNLLRLFNESAQSEKVPENWRTVLILSIRKIVKTKEALSSYCLIVLTSVGCKIMEHILHKRILDWIMPKHLFHEGYFEVFPQQWQHESLEAILYQH